MKIRLVVHACMYALHLDEIVQMQNSSLGPRSQRDTSQGPMASKCVVIRCPWSVFFYKYAISCVYSGTRHSHTDHAQCRSERMEQDGPAPESTVQVLVLRCLGTAVCQCELTVAVEWAQRVASERV